MTQWPGNISTKSENTFRNSKKKKKNTAWRQHKLSTAETLMKTTLMREHPSFRTTFSEAFLYIFPCKRTIDERPLLFLDNFFLKPFSSYFHVNEPEWDTVFLLTHQPCTRLTSQAPLDSFVCLRLTQSQAHNVDSSNWFSRLWKNEGREVTTTHFLLLFSCVTLRANFAEFLHILQISATSWASAYATNLRF